MWSGALRRRHAALLLGPPPSSPPSTPAPPPSSSPPTAAPFVSAKRKTAAKIPAVAARLPSLHFGVMCGREERAAAKAERRLRRRWRGKEKLSLFLSSSDTDATRVNGPLFLHRLWGNYALISFCLVLSRWLVSALSQVFRCFSSLSGYQGSK